MRAILLAVHSLVSFRFRSRASLELELIALRHQLAVIKRNKKSKKIQIKFRSGDRILWAWLYRIWPKAKHSMILLHPDTVVRWHSAGFRLYWRLRSNKPKWLKVSPELKELIRQMRIDNPLWGVRRIHAELLKLGYEVSTRTVHKHLPKRHGGPSPGWKIFLKNHMHETVAIDMFVVFTLTYRILYAMVLLSHERRRIIHFAVTSHPTPTWLANELTVAFQSNARPTFLLRDRDRLYGPAFRDIVKKLGIQEKVTAKQSPWQNIYVERVICSIRGECLNHFIIVNERQLRGILASYIRYYNHTRTHIALDLDCPIERPIDPPSKGKRVVAIPEVGGLHHRYERRAA